ncbi:hypothetical protein Cni_G07181 [Canna indica]|uniref:Myb-like domain-containing protein n=1 Tax=Canna indica TaxID=4628 RepID=A0AAQ3Q7A6_9LILI|nr:hypothetical protein Cni_G07181 [Canna indica]
MAFNHKDHSYTHFMPNQSPYEHIRPLTCGDQISLFAEDSPCKAISAKFPNSDEEQKNFSRYHKDFEIVTADRPYDNSDSDLGGNLSLPEVAGKSSEVIWSDNGKRLLSYDESDLCSRKHLKQADQLVDKPDLCSSEEAYISASEEPPSAAAEVKDRGTAAVLEDLANQETTYLFPRTTGAGSVLDPPVLAALSSSSFGYTSQPNRFDQVENHYSPVFEFFGRKHVAIGANHQAYVPEWRSPSVKNHNWDYNDCASVSINMIRSASCDDCIVDEDDSDKWNGTCIVPMPDPALLASDVNVLNHKVDCSCLDEGSIRCVRQHLMEERENLKQNLGNDRFIQLGFDHMGEDVSEKWTSEEEQFFNDVVKLNPASLGKDFWKELALIFPDRCSKDLVSYYFNVFMLRKRAEQNRLDPLHADSDDDEWQESGNGEFSTDEEDSQVESPIADQDDVMGEEDDLEETDITEHTDLIEDCDYYAIVGNNKKRTCGDVKGCSISESKFHSSLQFAGSDLHHFVNDQDIQGDSCTSFEGHQTGPDSSHHILELQHGLHEDHENLCKDNMVMDALSESTDNGIFDSHCDPKSWNISYRHGSENDDFLSTCNVIEEVFGKDSPDK